MSFMIPHSAFGREEIPHTAHIEQTENGFVVTLVDMVDIPRPASPTMSMEGPNGMQVVDMSGLGISQGPTMKPRERRFIARDLHEVGDRLADFFDSTKHSGAGSDNARRQE
jgi:hypothetical protein